MKLATVFIPHGYRYVFTLANKTLTVFAKFISKLYIFKGHGVSLSSADGQPIFCTEKGKQVL